jgi:hypothetical protein
MFITCFQESVKPATFVTSLIQFTPSNSISLRLILIFFCHLRIGLQNALLFSCVPNENVVSQRLSRLSLAYYTLRPLQIRWWIILLAGIIAITLYVCASVCVSRCQLLGKKVPLDPTWLSSWGWKQIQCTKRSVLSGILGSNAKSTVV